MNKSETIAYLEKLKKIVTPVTIAQNAVRDAQIQLDKSQRFLRKTNIVLIVIFLFSWTSNESGAVPTRLLFGGLAIAITCYKYLYTVPKNKEALANAQAILHEELNYPDYVNNQNGFPEKFYNYSSIFRLHKLLVEGRADELKEAFNLLEHQQF